MSHAITRRALLGAVGVAGLSLAFAGCAKSLPDADSFTNPLRIPPVLSPTVRDGKLVFDLRAQSGTTELQPGKAAKTNGYNGSYLGPTIRARRGDQVRVDFTNELSEPTTVHWHGMLLPAVADGGPHQMVDAGGAWQPEWTIDQPAATLWYHPHPHGQTARQVYSGLAGLFYIDDPAVAAAGVPSEYGVDDIPVIVQDRNFSGSGELATAGENATFGILGDTIVVNGTTLPYFAVTTEAVRLRILNGANARIFHFQFDDARDFDVIATDSGLLQAPARTNQVDLSAGERIEIVVRLQPGEKVLLRSLAGHNDVVDKDEFNVLRLVAADQLSPSAQLASTLPGAVASSLPDGYKVRDFQFDATNTINGRAMDMQRIDEVVPAAALEQWRVTNTMTAHNFHIHSSAFRILEIDGAEPPAWMAGPKDTVLVRQGTRVRLAVQFAGYTDPVQPYMYHCHMLRHEDEGMMGQFVVVEPGTVDSVARTLPQHMGH